MTTTQDKSSKFTTLLEQRPLFIPESAEVMTLLVEVPPGGPGTPPHRHSGPVFGYVLEGEIIFELEGEPERVIKAGEAFWEPGGDVIHYQDGNNLADAWSRFAVVMMCVPGQPMLSTTAALFGGVGVVASGSGERGLGDAAASLTRPTRRWDRPPAATPARPAADGSPRR
jgi:quercetin dioxygenase-like cupin family protein